MKTLTRCLLMMLFVFTIIIAFQETKIDKLEQNVIDLDTRCARLEIEKEQADSLLIHTAQATNELLYINKYGNTKRLTNY